MSVVDDFDQLKTALENWPDIKQAASPDQVFQRLLDASRTHASGSGPRVEADLASLLFQALRTESVRHGYNASLRVPKALLGKYSHRGLIRHPDAATTELISSRPWTPSWLKHGTPGEYALGEVLRRKLYPVDADPFSVRVMGEEQHLTISQRQAVRVSAIAEPGSTIVVNLPTGWGKTTAALAPALAYAERPGTSLVIVPTIALALDLERRTKSLVEGTDLVEEQSNFAYHGGLDKETKETIRHNVRTGRQAVVFASPESALTGLSGALKGAASSGLLRYFVIDEAHMVAEWGGGFRPEFQSLSGLRKSLLSLAQAYGHQPARTLLLSATITQHSLNLLSVLFRGTHGITITGSNVIRPEPEYWISRCDSRNQKWDRVKEAIEMAPRPMIVYTTTRADARELYESLQVSGYQRVALFTGSTSAWDRERILEGWRPAEGEPSTRYDIVVATSAFGLGVDLSHVRTIIHACVPESLDRFYQEVGRSGRDGNASLSLMVYDDEDLEVGDGLSREIETTIGPEKAWNRWQAMKSWKGAKTTGPTRLRVALSARRPDIRAPSEKNELHNRIVLSIMAIAGMVSLDDTEDPTEAEESEAPEANERPWSYQGVEIISGDLSDEQTWKARFQEARAREIAARRQSWHEMLRVLDQDEELGELLSEFYQVQDPTTGLVRYPEPSCGGCRYGRTNQRPPFTGVDPGCPGPERDRHSLSQTLRDLFGDADLVVAHYPADTSTIELEDLTRRLSRALSRHGMRSFVVDKATRDTVEEALHQRRDPFFFSYMDELGVSGGLLRPRMPELVALSRAASIETTREALRPWTYGRVLLVCEDVPDPTKLNIAVSELRQPSRSVESVIASL